MSYVLNMIETVRLSNGVLMPRLGLGTFKLRGEDAILAVKAALDAGYRHIDTASVYRNEEAVGQAIRDFCAETNTPRESIFVTSKLSPKEHGYDGATRAFESSLKRLNLSYIDLYLVHWPGVQGKKHDDPDMGRVRRETWRALQDLYKQGRVRAIGVSNFTIRHLDELLTHSDTTVVPAVNQVEFHPMCQQRDLQAYCDSKGIFMEAYSSLGTGQLVESSVVADLATKYGKSSAQILLRWGLQHGTAVLPKSGNPARIRSNGQIFDFELSCEDMTRLDGLGGERKHICWDPTDIA
eukprot:comp17355_c0_seq1/m.16631 comp17355_c0_seq1/g.16631  ORF comp17355_c0_seq1/g.16631 comp17355_c0_seq1/m.16631 type:complete len:295 (-) comp17355_c0_seq1:74-958(-)